MIESQGLCCPDLLVPAGKMLIGFAATANGTTMKRCWRFSTRRQQKRVRRSTGPLCEIFRMKKKQEVVPKKGLEPPHPCGYMDLNHARLPIPPLRLGKCREPETRLVLRKQIDCTGGGARFATANQRVTVSFRLTHYPRTLIAARYPLFAFRQSRSLGTTLPASSCWRIGGGPAPNDSSFWRKAKRIAIQRAAKSVQPKCVANRARRPTADSR